MNSREFLKSVLTSVKEGFPELYAMHVRGRRAAFVSEYAPQKEEDQPQGKIVGRFPNDLKMLWALAELLRQKATRFPDHPFSGTPESICKEVQAIGMLTASAAIRGGLQHCVTDGRYPLLRGMALFLRYDWSVIRVPYDSINGPGLHPDEMELFSIVISGAATIHSGLAIARNMMR